MHKSFKFLLMHFIHFKELKEVTSQSLSQSTWIRYEMKTVQEFLTSCSTWPHEIILEAYIYKKIFYTSSFFFCLPAAVCWFRLVWWTGPTGHTSQTAKCFNSSMSCLNWWFFMCVFIPVSKTIYCSTQEPLNVSHGKWGVTQNSMP